jgi:hypothetical protein
VTSLARTFVLRTPEIVEGCIAFIRSNAKAMADQDKPLEVRVFVHKSKRTLDQNALMWKVLTVIAEQAWVGGRQYDADVWNLQMKRDLLPEETASGKKKWVYLPNGDRQLEMSTSDLNVEEMSLYLEALHAHAATELGVQL